MNEQDRFDDPIDRLVRQYLQAEERRVDTDALLEGAWNSAVEGLMGELSRRRARRRTVRLAPLILAAAAVLLVAVALLVGVLQKPDGGPIPQPGRLALLPTDWQAAMQAELVVALRREVEAALQGARSSGEAAVSAGAAPLMELAEANRRLPELINEAGHAVGRFLGIAGLRPENSQKENAQNGSSK